MSRVVDPIAGNGKNRLIPAYKLQSWMRYELSWGFNQSPITRFQP
jgi:hypothetical protein